MSDGASPQLENQRSPLSRDAGEGPGEGVFSQESLMPHWGTIVA
jgi:hypothetical protein